MTNLFILNTIIEEDADYSQLIKDLTGGFVAEDIETKEMDESGEEVITYTTHPHADLPSPNFSNKIIFAHFSNDYQKTKGVDHITVSKFKGTTAWNEGVAHAKAKGATHIAILNNVSGINPHVITLGFEGNEDKTVVNLADGAAFIVDSEFSVEEKYNFWFVDNDIFAAAEEDGTYGIARVEESAIVQSELTSSSEAFTEAIEEDYVTAGVK
jgi:hypothetical protein